MHVCMCVTAVDYTVVVSFTLVFFTISSILVLCQDWQLFLTMQCSSIMVLCLIWSTHLWQCVIWLCLDAFS